jgi:alpha-beta hydrolase superfamily lysophospholipase
MIQHETQPAPLSVQTDDGHVLRGFVWRHRTAADGRPVVIINPATSVRCRYYARFASFLHRHGFDVVTYDYRGIGESRPSSLRGFHAGWIDWGRHDFEAVLRHTAAEFPGQPVQVVAHSVGGVLIGLAPSNHLVSRVFSMGAQFAYWRDYAQHRRGGMLCVWPGVMPALTARVGCVPASGWAGSKYAARRRATGRHASRASTPPPRLARVERRRTRDIAARFAAVPGRPSRSASPTTSSARLPQCSGCCATTATARRRISTSPRSRRPKDRHFAFFYSRFEQSSGAFRSNGCAGRVPPECNATPRRPETSSAQAAVRHRQGQPPPGFAARWIARPA